MFFTEPGYATKIYYLKSSYFGNKYHFCSDHCQHIFEGEPSYRCTRFTRGHCFPEGDGLDTGRLRSADGRAGLRNEHRAGQFRLRSLENQKNFAPWIVEGGARILSLRRGK
ncbi:Phenol 2-monooxygenase P3 subunit (fragment) (plasmid) [Cupriavidus taiwanensis]|uniref:Phenol 2-monooxygenase P3 subunit n=1 Tax=Cupriavidus taiwanensis TaxID=164546 RepID=A0A375HB88_9BURK